MKSLISFKGFAFGAMVALFAFLATPDQAQALGHKAKTCYTPSYTYCYTPCVYPQPCPPMKEYCVVYRYDPCYCAYVLDSYPADDAAAKKKVEDLKKMGYYAYYCCYDIKYIVYKYVSTTCMWAEAEKFGKGDADKAKAKVTALMDGKDGVPAYFLPYLSPTCVY